MLGVILNKWPRNALLQRQHSSKELEKNSPSSWGKSILNNETSKYKGSEVGRGGIPDILKEHNVVGEQ